MGEIPFYYSIKKPFTSQIKGMLIINYAAMITKNNMPLF